MYTNVHLSVLMAWRSMSCSLKSSAPVRPQCSCDFDGTGSGESCEHNHEAYKSPHHVRASIERPRVRNSNRSLPSMATERNGARRAQLTATTTTTALWRDDDWPSDVHVLVLLFVCQRRTFFRPPLIDRSAKIDHNIADFFHIVAYFCSLYNSALRS